MLRYLDLKMQQIKLKIIKCVLNNGNEVIFKIKGCCFDGDK